MSKRFRRFCDEVKVRELILDQNGSIKPGSKGYWFPSNKIINYKDPISPEMFQSYRSVLKLDQNLRRLHFVGADVDSGSFEMDIFNSLVQLEQLEIEFDSFYGFTLSLPNLKIFKIFAREFLYQRFKVKTPKLEALDCNDLDAIKIDQPETIKHLRTKIYRIGIEKLINLEILECGGIRGINKETLPILSNLKVLCGYDEIFEYFFSIEECQILISNMSFIMKQKLVLRRTELKVYFQGVQLTGNNLDDIDLGISNTQFQVENYDNLYSSLYFIDYVNYSDLTRLMKPIPDDYFNKFFQIHKICVSTKVNGEHLIWFVSKLNFVDWLSFKNASLDQSTMDSLLGSCDLKLLIISYNEELNFDCILKCKQLTHFQTDQAFENSFDLAIKAFSLLTRLDIFIFKKDDETVRIWKGVTVQTMADLHYRRTSFNNCRYSIEIGRFSKSGFGFNELITFCNHLANKPGVRTRSMTKLTRKY